MSMTFSYTKYTSNKPLSKKYTLDGDRIRKESNTFTRGTAETVTCSFEEFIAELNNAGSNVAFGYGTHELPSALVTVTTSAKENIAKGLVARTKDNFKYRDKAGIGFIDHDPSEYAPASLDRDRLMLILVGVVPSFLDAPRLLRASVSSGVTRTGQDCKDNGGVHIYFPVVDVSDLPRFGKALEERLWLNGHGFIALSANGSLLLRTLIDGSVFSGERLDFVGAPEVGEGLSYIAPEIDDRTSPFDDDALDTSMLKSLSEDERVVLLSMQYEAKANMLGPSKAKQAEWFDLKLTEQLAVGIAEGSARDNLTRILDSDAQDLYDEFLIEFADSTLGSVSVSDIVANPDKYDGKSCADPVEGVAYGRTTAKFYRNNDKPVINSYAHGGCKYFLHDTGLSVVNDEDSIDAANCLNDKGPYLFPEPFRGIMADTVQCALMSAHKPQPELTTLAVLIGMASAINGKYHLSNGTRFNLYGLGVAETCEGKDLTGRVAKTVAEAAGAALLGKPASGQGLEDALIDSSGMLVNIDEVGHMIQSMHHAKAAPHQVELSENLLKLYSGSSSSYYTRVKASVKNATPPRKLNNPCLNFLGFTTPAALSKGLSSESIEQGLLGRFLFVEGRNGVRQRFVDVPLELDTERFEGFDSYDLFDDNAALTYALSSRTVELSGQASKHMIEMMTEFSVEATKQPTPEARALINRSYEKVTRIAGVLAVWDNTNAPVIELEHLAWAKLFVRSSNSALLTFGKDKIHDNISSANAAKVLTVITKIINGDIKGLTTSDLLVKKLNNQWVSRGLTLKASKLSKDDFDKAVAHLIATGDIDTGAYTNPTTGKNIGYLYLENVNSREFRVNSLNREKSPAFGT